MKQYKYLIVGGGMTADSAVRGIRELDANSSIGMISAETEMPYGANILSITGIRSGRLPVIIVDDTSRDTSSTDRPCCVIYWSAYRKVLT